MLVQSSLGAFIEVVVMKCGWLLQASWHYHAYRGDASPSDPRAKRDVQMAELRAPVGNRADGRITHLPGACAQCISNLISEMSYGTANSQQTLSKLSDEPTERHASARETDLIALVHMQRYEAETIRADCVDRRVRHGPAPRHLRDGSRRHHSWGGSKRGHQDPSRLLSGGKRAMGVERLVTATRGRGGYPKVTSRCCSSAPQCSATLMTPSSVTCTGAARRAGDRALNLAAIWFDVMRAQHRATMVAHSEW